MSSEIISGDCRQVMPPRGPFDLIVADPPYGDTSLGWDKQVSGWLAVAAASLKPSGSLWLFGSMRLLLTIGPEIAAAGLIFCQDIVWEKQNGSGFAADRLKRVHEHIIQLRLGSAKWSDVYNVVPRVHGGEKKVARRKMRPTHMGQIESGHYVSEDGGPRIMRSVVAMRNCHGFAIHPTEKPAGLMDLIVNMSCPADGLVGDFFAGSGVVGEVCRSIGRHYVGAEIDPVMAESARSRMATAMEFA